MTHYPLQGLAALKVAITSVIITLSLVYFGLRAEKKRPTDEHDEH